jgi:hypothetical protein
MIPCPAVGEKEVLYEGYGLGVCGGEIAGEDLFK